METDTVKVLVKMMNKVTLGVLLCLLALILLHNNRPVIGFVVFLAGMYCMNRWNRRRK